LWSGIGRSGERAGQVMSPKREISLPGNIVLSTYMEICVCEQLFHLVGTIANRAGWDVCVARVGKIRSAYTFLWDCVKTRAYLAEVGLVGGLHLSRS
jgi:hypothetical protein